MPSKTFRMTWNSGSTLTKDNVRRALKHHFSTEFEIEEVKEKPTVSLDLLKTSKPRKKRRKKYTTL